MNVFKEKFLAKVEKNGNKKSIENLVVFVIILIATIIFINYIWNGNKKEIKEEKSSVLADTTVNNNITEKNNNLESQIENILRKLDGVEDVNVLITYEQTNKIIPIYNEDIQENITKEEDTQGRC